MKKAIGNTIKVAGLAAMVGIAAMGCTRPTQHESVYRTDIQNEYSWKEKGPGIFFYLPFCDTETVSHKRQIMMFPEAQAPLDKEGKETKLDSSNQLKLETEQSIYTARDNDTGIKSIMIQEFTISYRIKDDADSVRKHFLDHRPEDRDMLKKNLDGLVRTYLQTKDKDYITENQPKLGNEVLAFIKGYRTGGELVVQDQRVATMNGGYTIEDEWGIELTDITPRRIRPPTYVLGARSEADEIIKKGQAELDSSEMIASQRRSKLRTLQEFRKQIGDNAATIDYLTNQLVAETIEQLGPQNIGKFNVHQGLGSDQKKLKYSVVK